MKLTWIVFPKLNIKPELGHRCPSCHLLRVTLNKFDEVFTNCLNDMWWLWSMKLLRIILRYKSIVCVVWVRFCWTFFNALELIVYSIHYPMKSYFVLKNFWKFACPPPLPFKCMSLFVGTCDLMLWNGADLI